MDCSSSADTRRCFTMSSSSAGSDGSRRIWRRTSITAVRFSRFDWTTNVASPAAPLALRVLCSSSSLSASCSGFNCRVARAIRPGRNSQACDFSNSDAADPYRRRSINETVPPRFFLGSRATLIPSIDERLTRDSIAAGETSNCSPIENSSRPL